LILKLIAWQQHLHLYITISYLVYFI